MIPCQVCGKDSGAHRVEGFIPAPDSQKMALCREHDTPENRAMLRVQWREALEGAIRTATRNAAYTAMRGSLRLLTIIFSGGGSLSLPCTACSVTDHNALKITSPDGKTSFFPMQHIRRYDLRPLQPDEEEEKAGSGEGS